MKKNHWAILLMLAFFVGPVFLPGCKSTPKTQAPQLPGYLTGEDTDDYVVAGRFEDIWTGMKDAVLALKGVISYQNETTGHLEAKVADAHVEMWLNQASPDQADLRIKVYKEVSDFPDRKLSAALYREIYKRIRG